MHIYNYCLCDCRVFTSGRIHRPGMYHLSVLHIRLFGYHAAFLVNGYI